MEFMASNWEYIMLGFMILEKVVKLSPAKWDDILVDGIKTMFIKMFSGGK